MRSQVYMWSKKKRGGLEKKCQQLSYMSILSNQEGSSCLIPIKQTKIQWWDGRKNYAKYT